ncbi:DUF4328 domain-containing protein [Mycolicibacterium bacteremicum]|uniref:DUF4328 domain-containing protein n=1 Tax=Mycolicibacterium bacteremicum TaxID=564198 RepID=UPI0026F31CD0|nr:DUF4328 domain-containing protein [Mycolicibacterium bacteremicum]
MIQVCAQCGTRWNVRDRQRAWCPRCRGTLLAPGAQPPSPAQPARPPGPGKLPSGYRWIAVRPGAAPPPRRRRGPLGPTPRYTAIPRWGLHEQFEEAGAADPTAGRRGPSPALVRRTVLATLILLGAAAVLHMLRYALMLYNRGSLLNPIVAGIATWLPVAASVLAFFGVLASGLVLTNWLIARRAAAFAHLGAEDPRTPGRLWVGCMVPPINLVLAPVYVIELARAERRRGLRIVSWWITWFFSYALSIASIVTTILTVFHTDAQRIADNTVITTIAYLVALATLLLAWQVYQGFERTPVDRPAHRWVMVAAEAPKPADRAERPAETDSPVEAEDRNPAA